MCRYLNQAHPAASLAQLVRAPVSYCWLDNPRVMSSILDCSSGSSLVVIKTCRHLRLYSIRRTADYYVELELEHQLYVCCTLLILCLIQEPVFILLGSAWSVLHCRNFIHGIILVTLVYSVLTIYVGLLFLQSNVRKAHIKFYVRPNWFLIVVRTC